MHGTNTTLLTLCLLATGCGEFFEDPGAGNPGLGTGGASGDPRFIADCSNGPLNAPIANCQPEALASTGESLPLLADISSTTFDAQLDVTSRVARENPHLYYEIQALNELTPETGRWLRRALDEWMEAVEQPDENRFSELMTACRESLDEARGDDE